MKAIVTTLLALCSAVTLSAQGTRGIGIYPGAPSQYFGPQIVTNSPHADGLATEHRNLALHRTATASSSIDYDLTPHLVTDGICDNTAPLLLTVTTPDGVLPRREAEWTLDGGPFSRQVLMGSKTWIEYVWDGPFAFTPHALKLDARVAYHEQQAVRGYRITLQASTDGSEWTTVAELSGKGLPGQPMRYGLQADPNKQADNDYLPARMLDMTLSPVMPAAKANASSRTALRLLFEMEGAAHWDIHDLFFFDADGHALWAQPSQAFASLWMSNGGGPQWLEVDLGAPATIAQIIPRWYEEPRRWHAEQSADGRYVRLLMDEPNASGHYALRELEVWGTGGVSIQPHKAADVMSDGTMELSGGNWRLQRASEVRATGEEIASEGFDDKSWITATVPSTVLTSYINIGAVPNPNYADGVDEISESFFRSDFWYRDVFEVPASLLQHGALRRLHFDGINWKANVFLNGQRLGRIEGAFMRGDFDVSHLLRQGRNVLAVEVLCNEHFGVVKEKDEQTTQFNGGILGADNPTFHATIGWDWITTVRGRNIGIWNEVRLTAEGSVTLSDPYVRTTCATSSTTSSASAQTVAVTPSVYVRNHSSEPFNGTLCGWIGDVRFEQPVTIPAATEQEITFSPDQFPQLRSSDFRLWWPNGYGEPYRYDAGFEIKPSTINPQPSTINPHPSTITYKAGLREMTYEHIADSLIMYVNGRRFVPMGGNWGFDEHNLCYRRREYDIAVGYHRDMHCTMIRNWVGMIGDESFYDACDSLGVMIWQDFWLANPVDGPDPYDEALFMSNATDYLRRMRRHPAIAIYCGRNEGYPPATLDSALRRLVDSEAEGLAYIPSSADDCVTGHGPYWALPASEYFQRQTGKIHTERGMPAVMNIESLQRTFSPEALWPQSRQWGQHDYTLRGAQRASEFNELVQKAFGPIDTPTPPHSKADAAARFARRAQLINYNGYRAMFESTSRTRSGLLIWMSHPCWPSMVWQTYDYYFDPTAAYFGTKKACEPLHIQYNALTDSIEVVNRYAGDHTDLSAEVSVYDLKGRCVVHRRQQVNSHDDTTQQLLRLSAVLSTPPSDVYFLRLRLSDSNRALSENTYILGREQGNLQALNALPIADIKLTTDIAALPDGTGHNGGATAGTYCATVTLRNRSRHPAPFLRLNLLGADGLQILPAVYSDNYLTLMPDEERTVTITWQTEDARGQQPIVHCESILQ